jgi:hypothetical protein
MALQVVKNVLLRAATDAKFRKQLFADPETVLSKYDLTEEEKQCLKELDEETLASAVVEDELAETFRVSDIRI